MKTLQVIQNCKHKDESLCLFISMGRVISIHSMNERVENPRQARKKKKAQVV